MKTTQNHKGRAAGSPQKHCRVPLPVELPRRQLGAGVRGGWEGAGLSEDGSGLCVDTCGGATYVVRKHRATYSHGCDLLHVNCTSMNRCFVSLRCCKWVKGLGQAESMGPPSLSPSLTSLGVQPQFVEMLGRE